MIGVRKLMEKFSSDKDLRYLDDKMPDFHLRKKEDIVKRKSKQIVSINFFKDFRFRLGLGIRLGLTRDIFDMFLRFFSDLTRKLLGLVYIFKKCCWFVRVLPL